VQNYFYHIGIIWKKFRENGKAVPNDPALPYAYLGNSNVLLTFLHP
jgi:hypothetical protein